MYELDSPASARGALETIAGNLWFSWLPGARTLFEELDHVRFDALGRNPTALLAELSDDELAGRATPAFLERLRSVLDTIEAEWSRGTWWQRRGEDDRFLVAY